MCGTYDHLPRIWAEFWLVKVRFLCDSTRSDRPSVAALSSLLQMAIVRLDLDEWGLLTWSLACGPVFSGPARWWAARVARM